MQAEGKAADQQAAAGSAAVPSKRDGWQDEQPSATQQQLAAELQAKGLIQHVFLRVPSDYYEWDLESRRTCLGAPSIFHLCKSMVMHNTRADAAPTNGAPLQKYVLVVVQYAAAMHSEKLKKHMHSVANQTQKVGKQHFNPRLAPEEVSVELTGFSHNSVSPVGLAMPLPIIISHQIADLDPPIFWCGAGEVDLKVRLPVREFIDAYGATVVDCTYDERRTIVEV